MTDDPERTAAFMSPAKLAQLKQKPPASPGDFLDQMAPDAGHQQVDRLADLSGQMRLQAAARDFSLLAHALDQLAELLPRLDFDLLQPKGWLARATGKQRSAGAEFAAQYDAVCTAADQLRQHAQAQQKQAQSEAAAVERTIVEFGVECSALEKILEQGSRWLHEMREDLAARRAASADDEALARIRSEALRCERLVSRLQHVKTATAAARLVHQQAQVASQRRTALLQSTQHLLASQLKTWQARIGPLASAAGDSGSPALDLEGPAEVHAELQKQADQAAADCHQLQAQEQALLQQFTALESPLRAAA